MPSSSLLGYPIRRAAALEMFYGGLRLRHLPASPLPINYIKSEELPPPNLQTERDDLTLEIKNPTGDFIGLRLGPLNLNIRARVEAVRLRSEDCYKRLLAQRGCAKAGVPLIFPMPSNIKPTPAVMEFYNNNNININNIINSSEGIMRRKGRYFHPPSSKLSLFTRPVDCYTGSNNNNNNLLSLSLENKPITTPEDVAIYHPRAWKPMQMLKPIPHNWSPTLRSSGVRGPHMQLMQERLDGKGFGWKRKSRYLWQQDIGTAGFRPKRFF